MSKYMGHSASEENPEWQTLKEHVEGVTNLTEHHLQYLNVPHLPLYARLTGLLHDLGKYRDAFQMYRLNWHPQQQREDKTLGQQKVPHSDAGAKFLEARLRTRAPERGNAPLDREEFRELQFVIANHHGRLRDLDALEQRLNEHFLQDERPILQEVLPLLRLAGADTPELAELLKAPLPPLTLIGTERAFLIRFLLGALVDADRLDTEEHGSPSKVEVRGKDRAVPLRERLKLEAQAQREEMALLLARLQAAQQAKADKDAADPQPINVLRREMCAAALAHATDEPGFFRLTMPTGGGKTLASLAFGLAHAGAQGLRRVIYAVPFTTIIDQTARVFREVLERGGEFKVLEHHSNLEVPEREEGKEPQTTAPDLATENWDAPVIVTTTVRLFQETLYGTRTAQLRRLHNVSGSVIVLDEAQSLPAHLLKPTLDALQFLVRYAGCSVVLCTATQPALDESLGFPALAGIRDLVPDAARYFLALKRVEYEFRTESPTPWADLAAELQTREQVLCIVNTRQHAAELYQMIGPGLGHFHLSTNLCPVHRKRVLNIIKKRLERGKPCRVISTQLIEAGIDISFPRVYRAMGPLEAIVQAAGRCNRESRLETGHVVVFLPEDHKLPKGDYEARERLASTELREGTNLHDPAVFGPYFRDVYSRVSTSPKVKIVSGEQDFFKAHAGLYFEQVADAYQMIDGDTVPVIIRGYDKKKVDDLLHTIERRDSSKCERQGAWRALQQFTVSVYAHQAEKLELEHLLNRVPELKRRADRLGVEPPLIYEWPLTAKYHDKLGVVPEGNDDIFTDL
ncbi:CRISPR-associated endonuclease Cas3'' [Deinococcus sp.]|uniref:CRISPR-associated endonuclease Cas3'' n=1 Tax=Deinococcus sp. TaxID=47478 RepID=UPI003CC5188C